MKSYSAIVSKKNWATLRLWIKKAGICCEPSECGENVYLAIICTSKQAEKINSILDEMERRD